MSTENPNALKNFINKTLVKKIAHSISTAYPNFDHKKFMKVSRELAPLELKARVFFVTKNLYDSLPQSYPEALSILMKAMEAGDLKGFELWPFTEYVAQFGLAHFDESMEAMYLLTQRFTSEWAIRPFILNNHKLVLKYFSKWAMDKNVHVRRWVSEGTRPLLPWGMKLPFFIENPDLTLALLDKLKFDNELYVRKSVANHLNDISKHHPEKVIMTLKKWQKEAGKAHQEKVLWISRHALRTLIKKGHPKAFPLMGVKGKGLFKISEIKLNKTNFKLNETLEFSFHLKSTAKGDQKVIVDYAIDFQKANGKKSRKVFKLKTFKLKALEEVILKKKHSLKPITTMRYHTGNHHLFIQVNGELLKDVSWKLKV